MTKTLKLVDGDAQVMAGQKERPVAIAIDDGHSETKIAWLNDAGQIATRSFPSRTNLGLTEVDAQGGAGAGAYRTYNTPKAGAGDEGQVVMVLPRGRVASDAGDNRTADYPTSPGNRVLVHHALNMTARPGSVLKIGTTLPYSDFHLPVTAAHNTQLIEAKKANIARAVCPLDRATLAPVEPSYVIQEHGVYSEGVAAFFDAMLSFSGGEVLVNDEFARRFSYVQNFAVVDVGGKTTDIIYGSWTGSPEDPPMINVGMSESLRAGALDAVDDLTHLIKGRFSVKTVVDPERALMDRVYPLFGELRPIDDLVQDAVKGLTAKVREAVLRGAEDGSGLAYIIFVGGGSILIKDALASLFPESLALYPEDPQFANARGMLKMMLAE